MASKKSRHIPMGPPAIARNRTLGGVTADEKKTQAVPEPHVNTPQTMTAEEKSAIARAAAKNDRAVPSFSTEAAAEAVSSAVNSARTAAWEAKSASWAAKDARDSTWAAHKELLASHDQDIMSIRRDLKELQGDLGRIVKLLAQVLGGDFATEANTILTKRQEVS